MSEPRAKPAGDFDYETHGHGYATQRRTDPRIAALVHEALGSAKTVLNVGAGAGSYEPLDRHVLAIEPSERMRAQRPAHLVPAIHGIAEALPFDDASIDAAMAMITVHQWSDPRKGLRELRRVTRGPIVIMTFDGDDLNRFWLADYAPELIGAERSRFLAIDEIGNILRGKTTVHKVQIPIDCTDGFTEAYYARPEKFLESAVRKSQSAWGFVTDAVQERCVTTLRNDLENGTWAARYGAWKDKPFYEGSLRILTNTP